MGCTSCNGGALRVTAIALRCDLAGAKAAVLPMIPGVQ
jgi:hypothetical protein